MLYRDEMTSRGVKENEQTEKGYKKKKKETIGISLMTQRQKNAQKQKQKETWKYRKEEINRKTDRLERRTRHQRGHGQSIGLVACNPLHSTWHRIASH
jgi:hypothetical protein